MIDTLVQNHTLPKEDLHNLLQQLLRTVPISSDPTSTRTVPTLPILFEKAREVSKRHFGNKIYTRGLIEFTNYCKNDCYYCGIRKSNKHCKRYRLSKKVILDCCNKGYELGFRTFVLQGGEDDFFNDKLICQIVSSIKELYPDCAITLSIGEKSYTSYLSYFNAGANRYLLRHETASPNHYKKLHPSYQSLENRKRCLYDLKNIGYQVGAGFMVGSPYQTLNDIVADLLFLKDLSPAMIGIGPFIPHQDTPFKNMPAGTLEDTLILISILRLMFPNVLLPATTALATIHPEGREKGILAGANVVMPNLSPADVRQNYSLYNNKICTGAEAVEHRDALNLRMERIGYRLVIERGDYMPLKA